MSDKQTVLQPLKRLQQEANRIAEERGWNALSFAVLPQDTDDEAHVQFVVEWDPEKERVPDVIIVQAETAIREQQVAQRKEKLEADAAEAAEELRRQLKGDKPELDPHKVRRPGEGFL